MLLSLMLALALGTPKAHVRLAHPTLTLDAGFLAPVVPATSEVQRLGAILEAGVVLPAAIHLGVDGQPSMPWLSPFFYAQEIRITQIDPMSLAGSLLVTARVTL